MCELRVIAVVNLMRKLPRLSAFPITPTDENGVVDTEGLSKLVQRLIDAKVHSIGLLGSTGSYPYLSRSERRRAIDVTVKTIKANNAYHRPELLVGIGALNTREVVELARDAKYAGASAGLLAPVSYQKLSDEEVFNLFKMVSDAVDLPLIIYHNQNTTGFTFTPPLVRKLSQLEYVAGVKYPSSRGTAEDAVRSHCTWTSDLITGNKILFFGYSGDATIVESLIAGGHTWFSVVAGIFPKVSMAIVEAVHREDYQEARRLHARLQPLWDLFNELSSYRVTYAAVKVLRLCACAPPLPVMPLREDDVDRVVKVIEALQLE